jgi:hypothetical protein
LGSPSSQSTYALFHFYSKLMNILSGVSLLPKYIFRTQFLFKADEYPLWGLPPLQVHIPYSTLMQNWCLSSLGSPHSLVNLLHSILIQNWSIPSLGSPSSPSTYSLYNYHSKLMYILSGVSLLSKYIFIIQFLFKTDAYPLWGLAPTRVHIPYSILIQN